MFRPAYSILLAFSLGAAAGGGVLWKIDANRSAESSRTQRKFALLTDENQRLRALLDTADASRAADTNKVQRDAIEQATVAIRGLEFKERVDYQTLSRKEIKGVLSKKLSEVFSEQEFRNVADALSTLGLLESNFPLREKYIDLLGEQVAAFYDQHAHKLFMFDEASLDSPQNRVVLAHELTHALQDQHFSLARLPLESKTNDDRSMAASALVEGDATLVMGEYTLRNMSRQMFKDSLVSALGQDTRQLANAPRYLRETLVFPYLRGQEFCNSLFANGGFEAIDAAYARPPTSSAQILHPEKFTSNPREEPIDISWPDTALDGRAPIADNVLGELGIRILLSEWTDDTTAERAAAGWRGDRYLCYDGGRGLVWKSIWATAEDALDFFNAERAALERRHKPSGIVAEDGRFDATTPRHIFLRRVAPDTVVLIDAASPELAKKLADQFLN